MFGIVKLMTRRIKLLEEIRKQSSNKEPTASDSEAISISYSKQKKQSTLAKTGSSTNSTSVHVTKAQSPADPPSSLHSNRQIVCMFFFD